MSGEFIPRSILQRALFEFMGTGAPIVWGDNPTEYIQNGFCKNSDVYAIVSYIVKCSKRPNYIVRKETKGGRMQDALESDAQGFLTDYFTNEVKEALLGFKLLTGNSYAYIPTDAKGKPVGGLQVLPAHFVEVLFGNIKQPVGGYRLKIGSQVDTFPASEVSQLKYWNPDPERGLLYGMAPMQAAKLLVTQSNETFITQVANLQNQGPRGLLSSERDDFSSTQADGLEQRIAERSGSHKAGSVVMTPAGLKWIQMGLSPVDLEILETQRLTFEQVCRVWHFPVTILDSKSATLDNMTTAEMMLYTNCVLPEVHDIKEMLERRIVKKLDPTLRLQVDTSEIESLQENKMEMAQWLQLCPYLREDWKQELMGFDPDPNLKGYMYPSGMIFYPAGKPIEQEDPNEAEEAEYGEE